MDHSLFSLKPVPGPAKILGLAGLLPFISGGGMGWLPVGVDLKLGIAYWTSLYAALILSFLGGVRWGAAMQQNQPEYLISSVIHSLLAWSCLLLTAAEAAFALAALLLVFGVKDIADARAGALAPWYGHLRLWLTIGAGASMISQGVWLINL